MERSSGRLQGIIAAIGMLVLIFDSSLALEGARTGIELCIKTVIPSLFPFFVLSGMMINGWHDIGIRFAALLTKFMGIPTAASPVLIPAVMGGYPVGAKCVGALYQGGQIERKHAQRMLAFCNNAGPSFLFGMVSGFFPERKWIWLQWVILLSSALLTAAVSLLMQVTRRRMVRKCGGRNSLLFFPLRRRYR